MSRLQSVQHEGLSIGVEISGNEMTVKLAGTCDSQTKPLLDRFLEDLSVEAPRASVRHVMLDCESLYFINSASIKSFVSWLTKVKALPPTARYRVTARTNKFLNWQQRTFGAISRSAPDIFDVAQ